MNHYHVGLKPRVKYIVSLVLLALFILVTALLALGTADSAAAVSRVTNGLLILYDFQEGNSDARVYDVSGVGTPLNLVIAGGNTTWLAGGGLAVNNADIVSQGAATKINDAVRASNALTVEAWIVPSNTTQDGPARIVTLSDSATLRNFTLGQGLWGSKPSTVYDARLRTTQTDDNGQPSLTTPRNTAVTALRHVVVTFSGGQSRIYVNGSQVASDAPGGNLSNWNSSYELRLGNEATRDRPWQGELHLVAIYDRALSSSEINQNYQAGSSGSDGGGSGGETPTDTPEPPAPPPSGPSGDTTIYVSSSTNGTAGTISFADEDILAYDPTNNSWSLYFDGSDVGLDGSGYRDIDAFHLLGDGSILLSVVADTTIPDVGSVDESDIVRFVPTSLGTNTSGSFSLYFDGSDVGLTTSGEDIDALTVFSDGKLLISTQGSFGVSGVSGRDEDLLLFAPSNLGSNTQGSWSLYLDGSDVNLAESGDEDIWAVWTGGNGQDIHFSTKANFSVNGASGDGADILRCSSLSSGASSNCTYDLLWDGSASGFARESIDGMQVAGAGDIAPPPPAPDPDPTATPKSPTPTPEPGGGGGGGTGSELIIFDWNQPVTESHKGFPNNTPPLAGANGDWTKQPNYAQGTFHLRVKIRSQPVAQDMRLQLCFWQEEGSNRFGREACTRLQKVVGNPGNEVIGSIPVQDIWNKPGHPILWDRPRYRYGLAIKNSKGQPVSSFNGWNWNGEDPKKWYPLDMRFTAVVVEKGKTFSGWQNYK